jgi:gluconate 5-dehydrogenase
LRESNKNGPVKAAPQGEIMSRSLFDLTGRRALVTGSSRGIGFAIARGLAEAGASVVLNARSTTELESARQTLAAAGHDVRALSFDVTDPAAVDAAIDQIERDLGPIDALFNNAGIQRRAPIVDMPVETWKEVLAINLDSVFYCGRAVARRMIPRGRGKIVNTSSLAAEVARPTISPYVAAKGGIRTLTKVMCVEWAKHGIQVNAIGPGYFKTDLNVALYNDPAFDGWVRSRTPAGRWGEPPELAGAAVFLASDASAFVNGQTIYVDGGLLSAM